MKRFFCRVCKKVKRVRKWPISIQNIHSEYVSDRVGECNYHSGYVVRVRKVAR